jgi:hypothetical protein
MWSSPDDNKKRDPKRETYICLSNPWVVLFDKYHRVAKKELEHDESNLFVHKAFTQKQIVWNAKSYSSNSSKWKETRTGLLKLWLKYDKDPAANSYQRILT